jgi:AcrR family transcriptional regulator
MGALRELHKARRRNDILDAFTSAIRERGVAAVTVEQIAEQAQVSPATVYNLIGPRPKLLVALVDRIVDTIRETLATRARNAPLDPIATAQAVVDLSVAAFVADSHVYRQVFAAFDLREARTRDPFAAATLPRDAVRAAQAAGILRDDIDATVLGRQILLSYSGALFAWTLDTLSDQGFLAAARLGLMVALAAAATESHRQTFLRRIRTLGRQMASEIRQ